MKQRFYLLLIASGCLLASCGKTGQEFDASGTFEAVEVIVPAEQSGTILKLDISEGQSLNTGQHIGYIDSTQVYLRKKQLQAQIGAVLSRRPDIAAQMAALEAQLKSAESEQKRLTNLVKAEAATQKQLDDVNTQIEVLRKQIDAQRSALGITSEGIGKETVPLTLQIDQVEDLLAKCRIVNPVKGTVLAKYAEAHEMAIPGKPLYKIADLSEIILRAYISGDQLHEIKLGQTVRVFTDEGKDTYKETDGRVTWISDKAEFTPKTIQTKNERADLVYAVKIKVANDGSYKIGMYGEVKFTEQ